MSGLSLPRPSAAGEPRASERRAPSASRRLANAMTLPACVALLVPVAVLGLVILIGGLAHQDLVHAVFLAPDGVFVILASSLFLGLWVHRRLGTAVLAGADRGTALRAAARLTIRVVAVCLVVWAVGMALFLLYPGHDPLRARSLLEQAIWVLVSGTGLLWTGILLGAAGERWGWLRTWFVAFVTWAFTDALLPDDGPWLALRPWLESDLHAIDGVGLTLLAVVLAVLVLRRWEPAD